MGSANSHANKNAVNCWEQGYHRRTERTPEGELQLGEAGDKEDLSEDGALVPRPRREGVVGGGMVGLLGQGDAVDVVPR